MFKALIVGSSIFMQFHILVISTTAIISISIISKEQEKGRLLKTALIHVKVLEKYVILGHGLKSTDFLVDSDTMGETVKFCISFLILLQIVIPASISFYTG